MVACLSSTLVRVVTIHCASYSTSEVVWYSPSRPLSAVARCHIFAASFLLFSGIALTPHPVISWLIHMLPAVPSESARWHTITSLSDSVEILSLMTKVSGVPLLSKVKAKLMIEFIFFQVGLRVLFVLF